MRILIHSYFPVIRNRLCGGAQLMLMEISMRLAERGFDVVVLCPPPGAGDIVPAAQRFHVKPVLINRETLQRPLFPHEYAEDLRHMAAAAEGADVVWTYDRTFPFKGRQPVVSTLDNFTYREEIESLSQLMWDSVIVPSTYLYDIARTVVGPEWWDGVPPPLHRIRFGINLEHFTSANGDAWRQRIGLPAGIPYLLFPHRPDPEKGFATALAVIERLARDGEPHHLLIPINIGHDRDRRFYARLRKRAADRGVLSRVVFHEWVNYDDLPAYFSSGAWCLTVGTLPEGFGLTPLQAIACGTPVIATRAGALGELFPPGHGVEYVDFGDVDSIVTLIKQGASVTTVAAGKCHLRKHYDINRVVDHHVRVFQSTRPCVARYVAPTCAPSSYRLAPWCRFEGAKSVWHDYRRRRYRLDEQELRCLRGMAEGKPGGDADRGTLVRLLASGLVIPGTSAAVINAG